MKKKYLVLQIRKEKSILPPKTDLDNKIYQTLTDDIFYEDIYIYNKEEYFIDITNYEELYQKSSYQIAQQIKNNLTKKFRVSIKIGIGTNLFLAKTACDIITKIKKANITYLDEKEYIAVCSKHKPLSDFWQISHSMMLKLNSLGINTMEDLRNFSYKKLYEIFGYNAEYLINHSLGIESTTIQELTKQKIPKTVSSCSSFKHIKTRKESIKDLENLLDFNILKLKENSLATKTIHLYIKYANNIIPREIIPIKLTKHTNSYTILMEKSLKTYKEKANLFIPIEKLAISFGEIIKTDDITNQLPSSKKKKKISFRNIFYKKKELSLTSPNQMSFLNI